MEQENKQYRYINNVGLPISKKKKRLKSPDNFSGLENYFICTMF